MESKSMKESLDNAVNLYLKKVSELSIVRRLTDSISLDLDVERARRYVLDILLDEMDVANASIMLYDLARGGLVIKAAAIREGGESFERGPGDNGGPCFRKGEGAAGKVFAERSPILINDVEADDRFVKIEGQKVDIGSLLCLPLVVRDKLMGVLNLSHSEKNFFDREDRFGMMIVANQVAILLDNAENYRRVRHINLELEEKVRERTAELLSANEKLRGEIGERKRAEEALKRAEEEKALILNTTIDLVVYHDTDLKIQWANRAAASSLGMSPEELKGRQCYELWQQRGEPCPGCPVILARDTGRPQKGEIESPDGRQWVIRAYPVKDDTGQVRNMVEFCLDVTKRKRAEERLRESEASYKLLVKSLPAVVFKGYLDWSVDFFDNKIEELTGYCKEDFDSRRIKWSDLVLKEDMREMSRTLVRAIGASGSYVREYRIRDRYGNIRWIQGRGQVIRDKTGEIDYLTGVFFNITDRKRMEEELSKVEKLESVGVLAGGIAHDFNNLLAAILGNVSLAKMILSPGEREALEVLEDAEKASQRAKDLTKQLLTFSKGGAPVKETASINEIIKDSCSFALRGSNVKCDLHLPDDLWPVEIDVGQVSQVINNLLINADQAMPEGGILRVRAEGIFIDEKRLIPLKKGRYIRLTIEDGGIGIPDNYLSKIFDPFFTTKKKGSGLGLTTAYSIVRNHDGHITVESMVGGGTTFHIFLPASEAALASEEIADHRAVRGEGRILVMDDEEIVRKIAGKMLSRMGYKVEYASSGEDAVEVYTRALDEGRGFDAVILDLTVPGGMGGQDAVMRLREVDPDVTAIVSSGYSTDPVMADFRWYGFRGVVAKPYRYEELARAVSEAISAPRDPESGPK